MITKTAGKASLEKVLIVIASGRNYKRLRELEEEIQEKFELYPLQTSISAKLRHINNKLGYNVCLEKKQLSGNRNDIGYRLKWGRNQKPKLNIKLVA